MALVTIKFPEEGIAAAKNSKQLTEAAKAAAIAGAKAFLEVMEKPASHFASNESNDREQVV